MCWGQRVHCRSTAYKLDALRPRRRIAQSSTRRPVYTVTGVLSALFLRGSECLRCRRRVVRGMQQPLQ